MFSPLKTDIESLLVTGRAHPTHQLGHKRSVHALVDVDFTPQVTAFDAAIGRQRHAQKLLDAVFPSSLAKSIGPTRSSFCLHSDRLLRSPAEIRVVVAFFITDFDDSAHLFR